MYNWAKTPPTTPNYNRNVLVYSKEYGVLLAKYTIDNNWYAVSYVKSFNTVKENLTIQLNDVTHWQPLPSTPVEN